MKLTCNQITNIIRNYFSYNGTDMTSFFNSVLGVTNDNISELPLLLNNITNIEPYAFYGCNTIIAITIPNSVTSIGEQAFGNCTNLTTINIPWSEGAVDGAPWGATNATINYNYTGE